MANRYWVGGTANWDATAGTKWATTSGGAGGAAVPTSSDDVFFDVNSTGVCTLTVLSSFNGLDFTGFTGTFNIGTGGTLRQNSGATGNITMGTGGTYGTSVGSTLQFNGTSTFTSNGVSVPWFFNVSTNSNVTLADDLVITSTSGLRWEASCIFNSAGFDITAPKIIILSSSAKTIDITNSTITINGGANDPWFNSGSNTTLITTGSTIKMTGTLTANRSFQGAGLTFNNVWNATSGAFALTITGSNTFADFKVDAGRIQKFTDGTTTTVSSLTAIGTGVSGIVLTGSATGGWTISDSSGTNTVAYCTIDHSTATGGATWNAGSTSTDGGGNTGWNFSTTYTLTAATGSFTLTGNNNNFNRGYGLSTSVGSFTLTGNNILYNRGYGLVTSVGVFILTGISNTLNRSINLIGGTGAFTLTGPDQDFSYGYGVYLGTGSFTLGSQTANLTSTRSLNAEVGSFTLSGGDVQLFGSLAITAGVGSFTLNGGDVRLFYGRRMYTDTASFALNGINNNITSQRNLTAGTGSFALTFIDTVMRKGSPGTKVEVGSFTLNGSDANLTAQRMLTAGTGAFILTPEETSLTHGVPYGFYATPATFTLTMKDLVMRPTPRLITEVASFILNGSDVIIKGQGSWIWTNSVKHPATFTGTSKNSASWINETKH